MTKFRAFIAALALMAASLFVATSNVSPKTADALGNCVRAGQYYSGGTYAQIACFDWYPAGGWIRITITCKYNLLGIAHTYNVSSTAYWSFYNPATTNPAVPSTMGGTTGWATAVCGHHVQSGPNNNDWIIHVNLTTSPTPSYWGAPFVF